jgi:hypothetical protein
MADEEHLAILKQGVEAWNKWRIEHPTTRPDLFEADLSRANLSGAGLSLTRLTLFSLFRDNIRNIRNAMKADCFPSIYILNFRLRIACPSED